MKIDNISISNYRLLHKNISINLQDDITIVVGRNNSGKSSFVDVCRDLFEKKNKLRFIDFSKDSYEGFKSSYDKYLEISEDSTLTPEEKEDAIYLVFQEVPKIVLDMKISYEEGELISALSPFIMDLNPDKKSIVISCEFGLKNVRSIFDDYEKPDENEKTIVEFIRDEDSFFHQEWFAKDPSDKKIKKKIEKSDALEKIFLVRSILAQRKVDDNTKDNSKSLSKGFERFYKFFKNDDKTIDKKLDEISVELEEEYNELFVGVLNDLNDFGASSINIPNIVLKSDFDSERVLSNNVQYFYQSDDSVLLPENYNGLGYSNLIYMILQFASFFEEYKSIEAKPQFLYILLEEPEAHMHPQMQQVFLRNIKDFLKNKDTDCQIVITTHSSHILAESGIDESDGFDRVRYFDVSNANLQIKDLSELKFEGQEEAQTKKFLKQYLTLHKCDLFFADKAILVEGTTERILLPYIIDKIESSLKNEYVSIMEVGGAYAFRFKELLEFLNLKSLIITDIDSVKLNAEGKKVKTEVGSGSETSNSTLKHWMPEKTSIPDLLTTSFSDKVNQMNSICVVYQIPEEGMQKTARSLEEALILANSEVLSNNDDLLTIKKHFELTASEIVDQSYNITEKVTNSVKKTGFTFDFLQLEDWKAPKYINEGLKWLETQSDDAND